MTTAEDIKKLKGGGAMKQSATNYEIASSYLLAMTEIPISIHKTIPFTHKIIPAIHKIVKNIPPLIAYFVPKY